MRFQHGGFQRGAIGDAVPHSRLFRHAYDAENRLTAVREMFGDPFLRIWYDALGRRIMTEDVTQIRGDCDTEFGPLTTRHVYDGLSVVAEYDLCWTGQGWRLVSDWHLSREFVWGNQFPEPLAMVDANARYYDAVSRMKLAWIMLGACKNNSRRDEVSQCAGTPDSP